MRHVISSISISVIALNLLFWTFPILAVVSVKALAPSLALKRACHRTIDRIYHYAVAVHSWWIERVLGIDIRVFGRPPAQSDERIVVLSNHRSWFDILVIHDVVTTNGPIIQFLIKRELIYVPIVGWLCLALDFPRLNRGRDEAGREHDYRSIQRASETVKDHPAALLNFAEGTRFTRSKHRAQHSPYRHLLNPRSGGLRIMLDSLGAVKLLDVTLVYPDDRMTFWDCLGGAARAVEVHLEYLDSEGIDIDDINAWLAERWRLKDQTIEDAPIRTTET